MDDISFELIANSGVLVDFGDVRILVDGIFGKNAYFSQPVKEMQKAVFGMQSRFQNIDCLVFTHRHSDHFSSSYLRKYLETNQVKRVYLPKAQASEGDFAMDNAPVQGDMITEICTGFGEVFSDVFDGIGIRYHRSVHTGGADFAAVSHYSVALERHGRIFVFAADVESTPENFEVIKKSGKIEKGFVDPLFFNKAAGRRILDELDVKETVIYHIPFESEDPTALRSVAAKMQEAGRRQTVFCQFIARAGAKAVTERSFDSGGGSGATKVCRRFRAAEEAFVALG